jgi:hypothetical protein
MDEAAMDEPKDDMSHERTSPLAEIDARLVRLKTFETDLQNDETQRARQVMRTIVEPRLSWFDERGIAVTYHGSLQYNDPRNLDVDIAFVPMENLPQDEKQGMHNELHDAFTQPGVWPGEGCTTNFEWVDFERISKVAEEMGDSPFDPADESKDIGATYSACYVLSSPLLFESQRNLLQQSQQKIRQIAAKSKWLRDAMVSALDETIQIREERRSRQ